MCSVRVCTKNMGDPYYEPTIVVHDAVKHNIISVLAENNSLYKTHQINDGLRGFPVDGENELLVIGLGYYC